MLEKVYKKVSDSVTSSTAAKKLLDILYQKDKVSDSYEVETVSAEDGDFRVFQADDDSVYVENNDGNSESIDLELCSISEDGKTATYPGRVFDTKISFNSKKGFMKLMDSNGKFSGVLNGKKVRIIKDSSKAILSVGDYKSLIRSKDIAERLWNTIKANR